MVGRRVMGIIATGCCGIVVGGTLIANAALARLAPVLQRRCSAWVGGDVRWQRMRVAPWGTVVVTGLSVTPVGRDHPRVVVARLGLRARWRDLLARRWSRVHQVTLERPSLVLGGDAPAPPSAGGPGGGTTVRRLAGETIRITVVDATLMAPGAVPILRHGRLVARWQGQALVVQEAQAECLGQSVRAHGILTGLATADPQWQFRVQWAGPRFSGRVEVRDSVKRPSMVGHVDPSDAPPIPIASHATVSRGRLEALDIQVGAFQAVSGIIDWARRRWDVTLAAPTGGWVTVGGPMLDWRHPEGEVVLRDLRVGPLTVSSSAHLASSWVDRPGVGRVLAGTATTHESTVNHQPVGECVGSWTLSRDRLEILSLTVGEKARVAGAIGLRAPYPIAFTVEILGVDMAALAALVEPGKAPLASGFVQGRLEIAGALATLPRVQGYLTGHDGRIGSAPFQSATINFEGEGTVIRLLDSRIQQPTQLMIMEGSMDLARLGMPTVFEHVRMLPHVASPSWQEPTTATDAPQGPRVRVRQSVDPEHAAVEVDRQSKF